MNVTERITKTVDYLEQAEVPQLDTESPEQPGSPMRGTNLDRLLETTNIAEQLDQQILDEMGDVVHKGYKLDLDSKSEWDRNIDEWVKLATQVKEEKSWPWPKAANVKYPLLSTAAMQFAARAYPALVPADGKVVQMKVVGVDQ